MSMLEGFEIWTFRQRENRLLRQMVFRWGGACWSQVTGLWGICYRAVRESVTSATRGTRDVPNKSSVEMIRCRVEQVGALRDLGVRHAMERL